MYGDVVLRRVQLHLVVERLAYGECRDDLLLDLPTQEQEPRAQELLVCLPQVALDGGDLADDEHVDDTKHCKGREDGADGFENTLLEGPDSLCQALELHGLGYAEVEDAAHRADDHERPDAQETRGLDGEGVLLDEPQGLILLVIPEEDRFRQEAAANPGEGVDRGELEERRELQVAGVHRKLDGLDPGPGQLLVPVGRARHHCPDAAGGAHGHDAEHRGHRDDQEQPVHPRGWLPGEVLPRGVLLGQRLALEHQQLPHVDARHDDDRDARKLAGEVEVPEPRLDAERLLELAEGHVLAQRDVLRQVVGALQVGVDRSVIQVVVLCKELPYRVRHVEDHADKVEGVPLQDRGDIAAENRMQALLHAVDLQDLPPHDDVDEEVPEAQRGAHPHGAGGGWPGLAAASLRALAGPRP
mmetsp:Transcript_82165/g.255124  ORF Transcript_82165/g.255124 Transcript_82165/m.255124 type:complete len:414 (+) Transcript_82165:273-1514(+)